MFKLVFKDYSEKDKSLLYLMENYAPRKLLNGKICIPLQKCKCLIEEYDTRQNFTCLHNHDNAFRGWRRIHFEILSLNKV